MTEQILSDKLLEGIKSGELGVIYCEPLATFPLNMIFCPEREECQTLSNAFKRAVFADECILDNVQTGFCDWCDSDMWLLVATDKKILMCYTITKDFAEQIKDWK